MESEANCMGPEESKLRLEASWKGQVESQRLPRCSKLDPRGAKLGPRDPQELPSWLQEAPKTLPELPKTL